MADVMRQAQSFDEFFLFGQALTRRLRRGQHETPEQHEIADADRQQSKPHGGHAE